ncbi:MAG: sigma-70 family RNA polymerase sigma factor [Bacteroidota bacterium]
MNIPLNPKTPEYKLAQECRAGNQAAQHNLYQLYAKQLMVLCLRYVSNEEDAKEILTDTFVTAFRNFSKFDYKGEGSVQAWLKRIAVNQCLMHLRKNKLRFEEIKDKHEGQVNNNENVLEQMSAKEIMQLIHNLPPGYRTVFNLYVFEEMPHKDIAALLQISESTSKSQLYKARQLLQKQLIQQKKEIL